MGHEKIIVYILAVVLAGLGAGYYKNKRDKATDAIHAEERIERMRSIVREGMYDPYSAQFRAERIKPSGQYVKYCGEVNAKNLHGAYIGFRPFVVRSGTNKAEIANDLTGYDADYYRYICRT